MKVEFLTFAVRAGAVARVRAVEQNSAEKANSSPNTAPDGDLGRRRSLPGVGFLPILSLALIFPFASCDHAKPDSNAEKAPTTSVQTQGPPICQSTPPAPRQ